MEPPEPEADGGLAHFPMSENPSRFRADIRPVLDEILKVDPIDVFFVAPNDLATSMGHIGNMGHSDVQQTVDGAIKRIARSGRVAGTLVNAGNVERYTRMGVRVVMTSFFPWIQAGTKELLERAAAGARG